MHDTRIRPFKTRQQGDGLKVEDQELKQAGLKVTLPRRKILDILKQAQDRHLSAEETSHALYERGDNIALATIYRVLTQFEEAGLVKRHNFEGGSSVFELARGGHHDHVVCVHCGAVKEFYDETIEKRQREIAAELGFEIEDHALILYGRCNDPDCRERKQPTSKK